MSGSMSCKEATLLASKKEEGKISLFGRIKLAYHMFICVYCKRFVQQTDTIANKVKQNQTDIAMPEEAKNKIKEQLKTQ